MQINALTGCVIYLINEQRKNEDDKLKEEINCKKNRVTMKSLSFFFGFIATN